MRNLASKFKNLEISTMARTAQERAARHGDQRSKMQSLGAEYSYFPSPTSATTNKSDTNRIMEKRERSWGALDSPEAYSKDTRG
jgi:hypothetical protein